MFRMNEMARWCDYTICWDDLPECFEWRIWMNNLPMCTEWNIYFRLFNGMLFEGAQQAFARCWTHAQSTGGSKKPVATPAPNAACSVQGGERPRARKSGSEWTRVSTGSRLLSGGPKLKPNTNTRNKITELAIPMKLPSKTFATFCLRPRHSNTRTT